MTAVERLQLFNQIFGVEFLTMNKLNFSDSDQVSQLFKQAVNKAIENHRKKGESIAISDKQGKVKIIPASEIPKFQQKQEIV